MDLPRLSRRNRSPTGKAWCGLWVMKMTPRPRAFALLNRGRSLGTFAKGEISRERVLEMMAGGKELVDLETELAAMSRAGSTLQ